MKILATVLSLLVSANAFAADNVSPTSSVALASPAPVEKPSITPNVLPPPQCRFSDGKVTLAAQEVMTMWKIAFNEAYLHQISVADRGDIGTQLRLEISAQCKTPNQ